MTKGQRLARVRRAAGKAETLRRKYEDAVAERDERIVEASEAGDMLHEIADAAGVIKQRVWQIVQNGKG